MTQREEFEKWFKHDFHPDKTGPYVKNQLWFAWQAAKATSFNLPDRMDYELHGDTVINDSFADGYNQALSDVIAMNEEYANSTVSDGWIPVSERLPALDGGPYVSKPVLAFDKYDDVVFARYVKSGYWVIIYIDERREHGEITHWMPLPAAPEQP